MKTMTLLQQRIRIFLAGKKYQDLWRYALTALAASLLTAGIMSSCGRETPDDTVSDKSADISAAPSATAPAPVSDPAPSLQGQEGSPQPAPASSENKVSEQSAGQRDLSGSDALLGNSGIIQKTLRKGDSLARVLRPWGSSALVRAYIQAADSVFPLKKLRIGHAYELQYDVASRQLKRFTYTIDDTHSLIVEGDPPVARIVTPDGEEKTSARPVQASVPPASATAGTPPDTVSGTQEEVFQGAVRKGDTLIRILRPWGSIHAARAYAHAANGVFPMNKLRIGQPYEVRYDRTSRQLKRFSYTIDATHALIVEGQPPVARIDTSGSDAPPQAPSGGTSEAPAVPAPMPATPETPPASVPPSQP